MTQGFLGLDDQAFWGDTAAAVEAASGALYEQGALGIELDAPRRVLILERDELPLVGVRTIPLVERGKLPTDWCGVVAAVNLDTGEVLAAKGWEPKGTRPAPPTRTKEAFPGEPQVRGFSLDARRRLRLLDWEPARLSLVLVVFDERSNTVEVDLVGRPIEDPEVRKFLEARRTIPLPHAVWPPQDEERTRYAASDRSPPMPEGEGIDLAVERVVLLEPGARAVVHGTFRLPVFAAEVVPPAEEVADRTPPWPGVGDDQATAVLGITLLITGRDSPDPQLVELHVPTTTPLSGRRDGQVVEGHFAVDLLTVPRLTLDAQTYAVYALHGRHVSAARKVAFVTPDMLPNRGR